MFLDGELRQVAQAKARVVERAALRRQVIQLEVLAVRSRVRQSFSAMRLGFGLAGKALEYLRARKRRP